MTIVVGLTGGIASGKSTASAQFKRLGITVVDADQISHALTGKNGKAIEPIAREFGQDYILEGALNRARMRDLVFSQPDALKRLEAILHPMIHEEIEREISSADSPYVILDSALLVEKPQWRERVRYLIVIDTDKSLQIERLTNNRGLSPQTARAIIAAQTNRATRLKYADFVIDNSSDLDTFITKITEIHHRILAMLHKESSL